MSTPSIGQAIGKIRLLLTKREKVDLLSIIGVALLSSTFEVLTASIVVVFSQVLVNPDSGRKYMSYLGITEDLSQGRIIFYISVAFGIIYLVKSVVAAIEIFFQNFAIQKMNYRFKNKMLKRYSNVEYAFYLTRNSSYGMTVVGSDVEQMFSGGLIAITSVLSESIVFIFLICLIIYMNPSLAIGLFGIIAVLSAMTFKIFLPYFYNWGKKSQDAGVLASKHLMQFFQGFKEIVLFGKQGVFIKHYYKYAKQKAMSQSVITATNSMPRVMLELIFVFCFVLSIAVMCNNHENVQSITGVLGGYLYLGFRLMPGLNRIISQLNNFKAKIPFIERVAEEYAGFRDTNIEDDPSFDFKAKIEFNNVNFTYPYGDGREILTNVNLTINKNDCIGIVGNTGSGKSTLIDLLIGLLKPTSGKISVDGHDVFCKQWHQMIGYVSQNIYLTDDSIKANILIGIDEKDYDLEKLNQVIKSAQLEDFIARLPDGIDTEVGERGLRISGGEKQRIAIARALYNNPQVLIFDEATSALDNNTEQKIMETIKTISKDYTVIMIAHRLSTLDICNRIFKVENKEVALDKLCA